MRKLLQLATILALATTTATHAQITPTDKLIAPAPRNPALHNEHRSAEDLQWLWQFTHPSNKASLLTDARFNALLRENLKAPQAMWGIGTPLNEVAKTFLGGEGTVASTDNRYFTVTGCVADHCPQRGLIYADLGERNPLIVFAALRWNEQGHTPDEKEATFTLWLFPNRDLDAHQLPQALKTSLASWTRPDACPITRISNTIVVDPSGIPHVISKSDAGLFPLTCDKSPSSYFLPNQGTKNEQ